MPTRNVRSHGAIANAACILRTLMMLSIASCLICVGQTALAQKNGEQKITLDTGWQLQSSAKVREPGDLISTEKYSPHDWYPVVVPTTVVAALVKAGVYPDPTVGTNLRSLPGMSYPVGENFSVLPMAADSPFAVPWWYRKQFTVPASAQGKTIWLNLEGLNYRGNLWLNGRQIASDKTVAGAWRHYEFDITGLVHPGAQNVLAIEVSAPTQNDLAITFVDWNPMPPDKDMGIFREVSIVTSGPVALRHPAVFSTLNSPTNDQAKLTVTAQAVNATNKSVNGILRGEIGRITFSQKVTLSPHQEQSFTFDAAAYPQLNLVHPELWWPAQMGTPHLYSLHMVFESDGKVSDESTSHFGIRQITSEVTDNTRRLFRINGKPLLIRGGGYSNDLMLRSDPQKLKHELDYVSDMGLNTVRLEGRPVPQDFYDETDRRGILVMAGWSCCDFWEKWEKWTPQDHDIASASLRSQMYRLRGHPSLVMWLNGSDNVPPPDQEAVYLGIEHELSWPNPILSSATAKLGIDGAKNGVRMTGPYDYVAPSYWMDDATADQPGHGCDLGGCGGAHGFNTETSSGPAVPPVESLRRMLGPSHLWPIDATWNFHAGGGVFGNIQNFTDALNQRYGTADNVEDYTKKSQLMTYEGIRAMYEAYTRNKYTSTGVIQWMLNNAWPSVIWHLYDYYLRPGGGYFGAKAALTPLHALYSYDDRSIWAVSSQYTDAKGLTLRAQIFNLDATEKFSRDVVLDMPADSTARQFVLPAIQGLSSTYFLRLTLLNADKRVVDTNFYWLSTKPDQIDWTKSDWYRTPISVQADYTALNTLPKVKVITTTRNLGDEQSRRRVAVTIRNTGSNIAFFVRLKLDNRQGGDEILPVLWQDNYFSLLPGESRDIIASYPVDQGSEKPYLEVGGWNVENN